ncbi:MAG: AMP-binding protein, partial [Chitinivibrionales bacterium]|nr:AMP-binding protein [Chitinivibrionales bacterium]MBD3356926.1 AMP-binding protein [Chitinivibrionales bacterium]
MPEYYMDTRSIACRDQLKEKLSSTHTFAEMMNGFDTTAMNSLALLGESTANWREIDYATLCGEVASLSRALIEMGIQKGDRIGLLSANRIEWPITYLAIVSSGAIVVPIDLGLKPKELVQMINFCQMRCLFTSGEYLPRVAALPIDCPSFECIICFDDIDSTKIEIKRNRIETRNSPMNQRAGALINPDRDQTKEVFATTGAVPFRDLLEAGIRLEGYGKKPLPWAVDADDTAVLVYMYKDVFSELSHHALLSNAYCVFLRVNTDFQPTGYFRKSANFISGERWLSGGPFYHTYPAMLGFILPLLTNGTVIIHPPSKIKDVYAALERYRINYFATVPIALDAVYRKVRKAKNPLPDLKLIMSGGARLDLQVINGLIDAGLKLLQGYGLSEFSPIVTATNPEMVKRGSTGAPLCGVDLKIETPNQAGEGEILVRGPSRMKGYFKNPEKTREVLDESGWLHTGDIGRIDSDNYLWITGRSKPVVVNKGGKNVYLQEIEESLMAGEAIEHVRVERRKKADDSETPFIIVVPAFDWIKRKCAESGSTFTPETVVTTIKEEIGRYQKVSRYRKLTECFAIVNNLEEMNALSSDRVFFRDDIAVPKGVPTINIEDDHGANVSVTHTEELHAEIMDYLLEVGASILGVGPDDMDASAGFLDIFDSMDVIKALNRIEDDINLDLQPTLFFSCVNFRQLADYCMDQYADDFSRFFGHSDSQGHIENRPNDKTPESTDTNPFAAAAHSSAVRDNDIAVIGMSGRFPGASNLDEFWHCIETHRDCISTIPKERFDCEALYSEEKAPNTMSVKRAGLISDIFRFDAAFFNISPKEAQTIDPQHRLWMETVWAALEDAAYNPADLSGAPVGVFVGVSTHDFMLTGNRSDDTIEGYFATGNAFSMVANRVSYFLDITGPSVAMDTACSSSLTATCVAVRSLIAGDCSMAIVGGVNALLTPETFVSFSQAGMLANDGMCKTFSDRADGYVRGEGVGAVILKPLKDALRDHDNIHGVIKACAMNHGARSGSLTAPNPKSQARLLIDAYTKAEIDPRHVALIEAHGTGTKLGDPIEIEGLKAGFGELLKNDKGNGSEGAFCGLSSVKTNIGHLESAAGIAGLIKLLLALKNKTLPAGRNFTELNRYINLKDSPFYILRENRHWERTYDTSGKSVPRIG